MYMYLIKFKSSLLFRMLSKYLGHVTAPLTLLLHYKPSKSSVCGLFTAQWRTDDCFNVLYFPEHLVITMKDTENPSFDTFVFW